MCATEDQGGVCACVYVCSVWYTELQVCTVHVCPSGCVPVCICVVRGIYTAAGVHHVCVSVWVCACVYMCAVCGIHSCRGAPCTCVCLGVCLCEYVGVCVRTHSLGSRGAGRALKRKEGKEEGDTMKSRNKRRTDQQMEAGNHHHHRTLPPCPPDTERIEGAQILPVFSMWGNELGGHLKAAPYVLTPCWASPSLH